VTSQPYTIPDIPTEQLEPPAPPTRSGWPLAVWIIPDGIFALLLTLVLSIIIVIGYIGVQIIGGGDTQALLGENGTTLPPGLLFCLLVAQNLAFLAIVLLRTRLLRKLPLRWIGLSAPQPLKLIGWGLLFGILFVSLNFVIGWIFAYFGIESDQAELFKMERGDTVGQILMFLGAVVAAPIGEELFFRGYAFKALRENSSLRMVAVIAIQLLVVLALPLLGLLAAGVFALSDVWLLLLSLTVALALAAVVPSVRFRAYLISSAFFAVVHLSGINQGASALLAATFVGGLCLAGAFDRTGSIIPSIIAHAVNNSVAFSQLIYCVNTYGSVQNCG
jgi:uncharacterized protein